MDADRHEVGGDGAERGGVDTALEQVFPFDVHVGADLDPVRDGPDSVREPIDEDQRSDEDRAGEGDRPCGEPRASREARGKAQERARHACSSGGEGPRQDKRSAGKTGERSPPRPDPPGADLEATGWTASVILKYYK